ncbi:hypothetical protein [Gilliamella sp. Choc5-1]|nr:hypothetical protein [Gilliamella apicola]
MSKGLNYILTYAEELRSVDNSYLRREIMLEEFCRATSLPTALYTY